MPGVISAALEGSPVAPIRVLLAEPDVVSRRLISAVLEDEPDVTLDHVDDKMLIPAIQKRSPEIVILDIHTPAIRRAESWESLGISPPPATIVTTYDAREVSRFASHATDLLVKPFDAEGFQSALNFVKSRIVRPRVEDEIRAAAERQPVAVAGRFLPGQFPQRLAVAQGERIVLVRTADIEWMQSAGNQILLHLGTASHPIRHSKKRLQALLDPSRFLRVHRNAIVNLDHVEEFHLPAMGNMFVKMRSGFCVPLRKSSRPLLRRILTNPSLSGPTQPLFSE